MRLSLPLLFLGLVACFGRPLPSGPIPEVP